MYQTLRTLPSLATVFEADVAQRLFEQDVKIESIDESVCGTTPNVSQSLEVLDARRNLGL